VRVEATVHRPDRTVPIGVTTTTLDGPVGAPPRVTAIFTDISDTKRLEELHLRAERLEAVAELSSSLAHEIKNPLASIRSSVEQLSRSARANPDEKFLANLIVREADRLSRLLSEFLDFSRVRVTECRPVDLREVAGAAIRLVREHPDCPADAVIDLAGSPTPMEGDEDLLHRVVSNLVLNAVQATGAGARITVRTGRASPGAVPDRAGIENPVSLQVTDNGPGIPDDVRTRLFEPFVTGRVGGTGLGLAIVQRAVDALKAAAPDIVLTDIRMPQVSGIDILAAVKEQDPETPVVLMTAQASLQSAIQAVNQGAFHYVQKPFSNDEIIALCRRAAEVRRLKSENKQLKQEIRRRERSGQIEPIGKSRLFLAVMQLAKQVAPP